MIDDAKPLPAWADSAEAQELEGKFTKIVFGIVPLVIPTVVRLQTVRLSILY
jgi:hypothetical protein